MIYNWGDIPTNTKFLGEHWYGQANANCVLISKNTGICLYKVVGVVAALSPKMNWENNLKQAEKLCLTRDCASLLRSKKYACDILDCNGSIDDVLHILKGRKTNSFFLNILNVRDNQVVTLDSHMGEICRVQNWTPKQYDCWEMNIVRMARDLQIKPSSVQATLWIHHKFQKSKK